jgi:hypothetical protein
MAEKRAQIDATLRGTASSDLFTQDVEDMERPAPVSKPMPEREPGADDDPDWVNEPTPEAAEAQPVTRPQPKGQPCPSCGKPAGPSKFPKSGKTHYCGSCRASFEPGA